MVCLLAGVVAGVIGTTLRSVIGRARPEVGVEQGWFGPRKDGRWIIGRHAYSAFPSGHASIAAGFGVMAFGWRRRAGGIGVVYAVAVAWSRFHLGAHRASDVWAGLMVGSLTAAVMWPRCRTWVDTGVLPAGWPLRWRLLAEPSAGTAVVVTESQR
jgi:membrane-associated phospholipid phosphatase